MSPEITQINFVVQSRTAVLDQTNAPVPTVLQPGVIDQILNAVQSSRLSNNIIHMICVDGKCHSRTVSLCSFFFYLEAV